MTPTQSTLIRAFTAVRSWNWSSTIWTMNPGSASWLCHPADLFATYMATWLLTKILNPMCNSLKKKMSLQPTDLFMVSWALTRVYAFWMYRHVFICVKWFGQWSDRGKTSESFKITWASCWCCWCHSWWLFPLKDEMLSQFDFHMGLAHRIWCWRPICWSAKSCWMRGSKWVSSERSRRWTQISTVKCWSKNSRSFSFVPVVGLRGSPYFCWWQLMTFSGGSWL